MKIPLPKESRHHVFVGLKFDSLIQVDLTNIEVEKIVSALFQRLVDNGRVSSPLTNLNLNDLVKQLATHSKVKGFDSDFGEELLIGWLKSSVLKMKFAGKAKLEQTLSYIKPINIATYRAGLPYPSSERRSADIVIYNAIIKSWTKRSGSLSGVQTLVRDEAKEALGHGVMIPSNDPRLVGYDEATELDITQVLLLRFLDTFPMLASPTPRVGSIDEFLPGVTSGLGEDFFYLFRAYKELPAAELMEMMVAFVALRLYQIPLRTQFALANMMNNRNATDALGDTFSYVNPLEIYCDFTDEPGPSQDLSKMIVRRDLEQMQKLLYSRVLIKCLETCIVPLEISKAQDDRAVGPDRLEFLITNISNTEVNVAAGLQIDKIRTFILESYGSNSLEMNALNELLQQEQTLVEKLAAIIYTSKENDVMDNHIKWLWNTGGLQKDRARQNFALLDGSVSHRYSWRYQPSDSLLSTLIALCMVKESNDRKTVKFQSSIPLSELICRLNSRFGILINRVPVGFETPESHFAAAQNMNAFKNRLKQLGCFQGLSDDSDSQPVTNPKVKRSD